MRIADLVGHPRGVYGPGVKYTDRRIWRVGAAVGVFVGSIVAGLSVFSILVAQFDAPFVLGGLIVLGFGIAALFFPEAATILGIIVLYSNLAVVASQVHGVPKPIAAGSMALFAPSLLRQLIIRRERIWFDTGFALACVFLFVACLSSLGAKDPGLALSRIGVRAMEGVGLYLIMLNVIRSRTMLKRVIWAMLFSGALLATLTMFQSATGSYSQEFGGLARRAYEEPDIPAGATPAEVARMTSRRHLRALGPMTDPNRFAQILIVLLPLAFFCYRQSRNQTARLAAIATGAAILGGMVLTYSRGAIVTLALLAVALALIRWVKTLHLVALGVVVVTLTPIVAPRAAMRVLSIANVPALLRTKRVSAADGAIRGRITEMAAGARVFLDHPVLGVGPGQYAPYYSVEYQNQPEFQFRDIQGPRRAHSLYIELGAELGALGLASFFALIIWLCRTLLKVRRRYGHDPWMRDLASAAGLMILCYLGTGVFLHLSYERYFWLVIGFAGTVLWIAKQPPTRDLLEQ